MYEIYLDEEILYYPGDKINAVSSAVLSQKLNDSGELNITIPATNPLVDKINLRVSELVIKRNDDEIWRGETRRTTLNIRKEKTVYCVGELAYLNASEQPQKKYTKITIIQFMESLLSIHNSMVEKRKQFKLGIVAVNNSGSLYDFVTNYEGTLDYIRSEICDKFNCYVKVRRVNNVRYLDLLSIEYYGKSCEQPIKFGKNILDYSSGLNADNIVTIVRPLGEKQEESVIEGIDSFLTIESINNGIDYIENVEAINSGIGKVWRTIKFDDISDVYELKEAGEEWIKSSQFKELQININAVDLSELNHNIESFNLGDSVRVIATPFGIDKWSYITEKALDLLHPATTHNISIGEHVTKSYTQQSLENQAKIKKEIPQQSALLDLAKENASQLIKSATEGNIFLVYNDDGTPKELLIMDTPDITTAKKVWRWNINGLGYSSTGYEGTYGIAMTMDGTIVADFIKSGKITGVVFDNGNGTFLVDKDGNVVANSFRSNFATITGGNITLGDKDGVHYVLSKTGFRMYVGDDQIGHMYIDELTGKAGLHVDSVTGDTLYVTDIQTKEINGYTGLTETLYLSDSGGEAVALVVKNGIITGKHYLN